MENVVISLSTYNDSDLKIGRLVTLLDIMRVHAEAYSKGMYSLVLIMQQIEVAPGDFRKNQELMARLHGHLSKLLENCGDLPLTAMKIKSVLDLVDRIEITATWKEPKLAFLTALSEIRSRLDDELSSRLFFGLSAGKAKFYDGYREGWEEVIDRFPPTLSDIEEMSKCFAFSRYPASVFHSLQVVEHGIVALGDHIGVTDPKRGWDATSRRLAELVHGGHRNLPSSLVGQFSFLEQVNQCVQAMKHAWRNKINHTEGRLTVLSSDFTSDIAEEIMMASRGFMRRLAAEMPTFTGAIIEPTL